MNLYFTLGNTMSLGQPTLQPFSTVYFTSLTLLPHSPVPLPLATLAILNFTDYHHKLRCASHQTSLCNLNATKLVRRPPILNLCCLQATKSMHCSSKLLVASVRSGYLQNCSRSNVVDEILREAGAKGQFVWRCYWASSRLVNTVMLQA